MSDTSLTYKPAFTIHQDKTVKEALKEMVHKDSNSLCVVSEDGQLLGIISIQDIAVATVPEEFKNNLNISEAMYKEGFFKEMCQSLGNKPVKNYMRKQVMAITPDTNIMTVTADFLMNDLYNVPVTKDDKLLGVITRSDIRDELFKEMGDAK